MIIHQDLNMDNQCKCLGLAADERARTLDEIYESDVAWVKLMNNKIVQRELLDYILSDASAKASFRGSFLYDGPDDNLRALVDTQTIDIVSDRLKGKKGKGVNQSVYSSIDQFFTASPLVEGKINYYLIGDASGQGKFVDVHWICLAIDTVAHKVLWYDPAYDESDQYIYNFNYDKLADILVYFNSILPRKYSFPISHGRFTPICGSYRAQQICAPGRPGTDIFCQSWVLLFIASHSHGLGQRFLNLDFASFQNVILKAWLVCLLTSMQEYQHYPSEYFGLAYCRFEEANNDFKLLAIPRIEKRVNCTEDVIAYFEARSAVHQG